MSCGHHSAFSAQAVRTAGAAFALVLSWAVFSAPAFAGDDSLDSLDDEAEPASPPDANDDGDDNADKPEKTPAPAPPVSAAADSGPSVYIRPFAGVGMATRGFTRPANPGVQHLSVSPVPAVEVGLDVIAWPEADFALTFQLHYQSAVGFKVEEHPPLALPNEVKVRSERVELSVAPSWRIGSARLALPIGVIVRTFWPNVHTLLTPGYSLIGPHARAELSLPLGGSVSLRVGPEVQWIVLIDDALLATGLNLQGIAIGGEAGLSVEVSPVWTLGLHYRESHALVNTNRAVTFEDIERYLTVRVVGTF